MKANVKNENGVSLIELMLAIAVFVIGSATVAHLFIGGQLAMNYNLEKSQAMILSKQGIEEQRANRNNYGFNSVTSTSETITLDGKDFQRTVGVSFPSSDKAEITSTIEWTFIGRQEDISFIEIITDWNSGV